MYSLDCKSKFIGNSEALCQFFSMHYGRWQFILLQTISVPCSFCRSSTTEIKWFCPRNLVKHTPAQMCPLVNDCFSCKKYNPKVRKSVYWSPESGRPGPSWKTLGSVTGAWCWRPPVAGRQVIIFILRNLWLCRQPLITTVHGVCWPPTRGCSHHSSS